MPVFFATDCGTFSFEFYNSDSAFNDHDRCLNHQHPFRKRERKQKFHERFHRKPLLSRAEKQARKTNESKERSIRTGSRFIKDPTLLILRKSRNSLAGNRRKLRLSAIFLYPALRTAESSALPTTFCRLPSRHRSLRTG